jgi:hypothetical protein
MCSDDRCNLCRRHEMRPPRLCLPETKRSPVLPFSSNLTCRV